jgi:hypothetical protein
MGNTNIEVVFIFILVTKGYFIVLIISHQPDMLLIHYYRRWKAINCGFLMMYYIRHQYKCMMRYHGFFIITVIATGQQKNAYP